jgi:hypothetical protein
MTSFLLDHPWPVEEALDARSAAFGVLIKFSNLIAARGVPVAFMDPQECYTSLGRLNNRHSAAAAVRRFVEHCVRHRDGGAMATPVPDVKPPLSVTWKRALRDALEEPSNWRSPQIVVPACRRGSWPPGVEVAVHCEDRAQGAPEWRVLATLETYDVHECARADLDPWRAMEVRQRPLPDARINHPCVLPRPPLLHDADLDALSDKLPEACRVGWEVDRRCYFVPPRDYRPKEVDRRRWREGRAFPQGRTADNGRSGPIDYRSQIWAWDIVERHWDVQLPNGGYRRISHDGREL